MTTHQTRTTTKKKQAPRRGRPRLGLEPRRPVLLKIDPAVIDFFRTAAAARGIGYQTLMHDVLASPMLGADLPTCRRCEHLDTAIATFSNRKDTTQ